MNRLRIWKRRISWDLRSALVNPLVVFSVSIGILCVSIHEKGVLYVLPLAVLAVNSLLSFAFWTVRLSPVFGSRRPSLVRMVGVGAAAVGWGGLLTLIVLSFWIVSGGGAATGKPGFSPDGKFWIFWSWAMVEGIHHYIYKLTFGRWDTLQHVIENADWRHAGKPLGGAVGVQLRKLGRRAGGL
jgi:hypothetical protein